MLLGILDLNRMKKKARLFNPIYDNQQTSLLCFVFEPDIAPAILHRFNQTQITYSAVGNKDVYLFDGFFSEQEAQSMRLYSSQASFSRYSYGSPEAIQEGELPARAMDPKERWLFFSQPPEPVKQLYLLLRSWAQALDVEITMLPWELCDGRGTSSPALLSNRVEKVSSRSMFLGKHQDCIPEQGLPFAIPILYAPPEDHPAAFVNGTPGRPWMMTLMLYVTADNFLPTYQTGSVFFNAAGEIALRAACTHMRLVLFESDLWHAIEESNIPPEESTWRISYVFKLIFNPKRPNQDAKAAFAHYTKEISKMGC